MIPKEKKYRIKINYDLSMESLDKYFPGGRNNRREAYRQIENYLLNNNFEHTLFSGYTSLGLYADTDVVDFVNDFFDYDDWVEKCMKVCHITVVKDKIIDALEIRKLTKEILEMDKINLDFQFEEIVSLDAKLAVLKQQQEMFLKKARECEKEIKRLEKER